MYSLVALRKLSVAEKLLACRRAIGAVVGVPVVVFALVQTLRASSELDLTSQSMLFAAGLGVWASGFDRMRLARAAGAFICLVSLVILLGNLLSVHVFHFSHPLFGSDGLGVTASQRENKAMFFSLIGAALLTIESFGSVFGRNIFAPLLGLIVFSLGALSTLGYTVNSSAVENWQLFARISIVEAASFTAIGLALIALGWSQMQLERASLKSLGRATYVFLAAGVFTVALVSAGFGVLGLGETVYLASKTQVQQTLMRKTIAIDHFIAKYKLLAAHVSNNPDSIQLLDKLNQNQVREGEYREQVGAGLEFTSALNDEILGVARFDAKNQLVVGAGRKSDLALDAGKYVQTDSFQIAGPFLAKDQFYLFAVNPVYDSAGLRTATDIFVLDGKVLRDLISETGEFGHSARLYLSALHGASREVFGFFDRSGKLTEKMFEFGSVASGAQLSDLFDPAGTASLASTREGDRLEFHAATIQAPWQLYLSVARSELLARSRVIIIHSLLAAALLGAFSAAVLLFFSRKLIHRTLSLQEQLLAAGESLEQEAGRRELAERLAKRREKEAQLIVEKTSDAVISFYCADGCIRSFSPAAEEIFGYSEEELQGKKIDTLLPRLNGFWKTSAHVKGRVPILPAGENEGRRKNGSKFPLGLSFETAVLDDQEICFGLMHDLSEKKRTEAAMQHSMKEKEVLLREVHHRVKNNLQIISSLFRLQARRATDEKISTLLEESQNRIQSIALVHETLYRSDDFSRIDMGIYLREIVNNLKRSLDLAKAVELRVAAKGVLLALDFAIPCGLMVNEIATNAIRHAFPDPGFSGEDPHVLIEMRESSGQVTLVVTDNGIGLPPNFDASSARSLGLRLIQILCSQIDGSLDVQSDHGAKFIVSFNGNVAGYSAEQEITWQERKF